MIPKCDASITEIYGFDQKSKIVRPLFMCGISAGFPSPADDYIERLLDLNEPVYSRYECITLGYHVYFSFISTRQFGLSFFGLLTSIPTG